jgi:hypothetical protein
MYCLEDDGEESGEAAGGSSKGRRGRGHKSLTKSDSRMQVIFVSKMSG